jgi:hypothetical protein
MKTIILGILISLSTNLFAQTNDSLRNYNLDIELSIIHTILGCFGGTIGIEKNHSSFGVMGFGTKLNHMTKHYLMENAEELAVYNWGIELYSDYYFKQNHRGLFIGTFVSLNGFRFTDIPNPQTILVLYAVPRIGYRKYLPKKKNAFYFQPSLTLHSKVWDNQEQFLYREIDTKRIFLLSQLTIGMKI